MLVLDTWKEVVLVIIGLLTYLCYYASRKYRYFSDRGIPTASYTFLLGSNFDIFRRKKTFGEVNDIIYKELKGNRWGGFFQLVQPLAMILDPTLVKAILIKDFANFHDHFELNVDENVNPMMLNLFNLTGERWRTLRHKLTPTFTSGRLKWMFEGAMAECGTDLGKALKTIPKGEDLEIKELFARLSTDIIASCAFGIKGDAMANPDCKFRQMSKQIFDPPNPTLQLMKGLFFTFFPKLFKIMGLKLQFSSVEDFFISITKQGFEHRRKTGERRPDFLQLLLDLKDKGTIDMERTDDDKDIEKVELEMTDNLLAAQTFVFFLAGFENTAMTMAVTCYFLSKNPDIQAAVQREIRQCLARSGGSITYESLKDMKLLEACVNETLRLYTPADVIFRTCNKKYETTEGTINEKDAVIIPVYSLHRDPDYFPEPDKFIPQRFLPPDVDSIQPGTYLPFGDGPRICIAQRFALLQIKLGVCKILEHCTLLPSTKNQEPLRVDPTKLNQIIGGIWVKLQDNEM